MLAGRLISGVSWSESFYDLTEIKNFGRTLVIIKPPKAKIDRKKFIQDNHSKIFAVRRRANLANHYIFSQFSNLQQIHSNTSCHLLKTVPTENP